MDLNRLNKLNTETSQKYDIPINFIMMSRSDHYPAAYFRSSLFILGLTYLIFYFIPFDVQDPIWMIGLSIPAVFLGQILAFFPRYKRFFISNSEMKEECYQQALEQGHELGVLNEPTSLFIYLSVFESRIEVFVPDHLKGIKIKEDIKSHFKKLVKSLKKSKKNDLEASFAEFYDHIFIAQTAPVQPEKLDTPPANDLETLPKPETNKELPAVTQSTPYNVE